ncbi:hypothetical protein [Desulfosediminicola flagellatus]|uniref:hypothetical protein n=1 Tax=Desulfosediminicola flagellatus TaxID=2569541 RepID=UPI0010ABBBA6|nr:hypothetical protein [Desulfosediminicola flagellatus]
MARPCSDLNDALQAARKHADDCWDTADQWRNGAMVTGATSVLSCSAIIPTIGGPFGLGGGTIARDKLIRTCLLGAGSYLGALYKLNRQLDLCNEFDIEGEAAAHAWLKCYNNHKEALDKFLRPNDPNV